ncbi:TPA: hypothetical protein ACH3X2_010645 [Trebouxia sp. C0005]
MKRTTLPCVLLLLSLLAAPSFVRALHFRPSAARRLLHDVPEANSDAVSSTSYLDTLQARGVTAAEQLNNVLGLPVAGALNEDDIAALLQDVQGDSAASATANTSLSADNIIDTYGDADRELNATATSSAALAILACKADINCQIGTVEDASDDQGSSHSIAWLKWTGAAVLFVEALIGLLIPFFLKLQLPILDGWFLAALNCFAGGVFLTFGFMHLLPDAVSATSDSLADSFPMAYFFAALGFYLLFLMQKVVAPMLSGSHVVAGHHGHAHDHNACTTAGGCCAVPASLAPAASDVTLLPTTVNPAYTPGNAMAKPLSSETSSADAVVECTNCGCDLDTSPETAQMTQQKTATVAGRSWQGMTWQMWLSPIMMWAGICVHGVLEGLSLGLQHDKAGAVTVLVAMVSHKWVESVALSSMLVKNGGGFKEVWICLLPFAACFFLGTGIGVGVGHDENPWVDIVLFGLIAGAFIFVGGYELIATEFTNERNLGKSKYRRAGLFLPIFAGFVLVALLQLVHGS